MSIFHELKDKYPHQQLWEDDMFFCLLDGFPVSPGHALVIPQREVQSVLDLSPEEWTRLHDAVKTTIEKLASADLVTIYSQMQGSTDNDKAQAYLQDAIAYIQQNGYSPDAYNHGINDGIAAGRTVHHLHWHVIPRFEGDVEDPRGGVRYIFPEKGNYKK